MAVTGILIILLITGKTVKMMPQKPINFYENGKEKVAEGICSLWQYAYPAGGAPAMRTRISVSGELQHETGMMGLLMHIREYNPVFRFLISDREQNQVKTPSDPAYGNYIVQQREKAHVVSPTALPKEQIESEIETKVAADMQEDILPAAPSVERIQEKTVLPILGSQYVMEQLADYDFLMKHFYNIHSSTTAGRQEMSAKQLLEKDLTLHTDASQPQILIYHTHSQESYADYGVDQPDATVVGIGNYLTELLQKKDYNVIHHTGVYDLKNGQLDRNKAYTYALDGITGILQKYPSIEVVLDLHRDGVKESLHMVSEVNGKQTAPIMFFNGMSQTPSGAIAYLPNPYKEDNLAFSLRMQLDAAAYYPGFTRKIYLKGLRYNLHLRPKSALVEVGAQTNTYAEARNAMEPFAELLDRVLQGD